MALEWITKTNNRNCGADVTVSLNKNKDQLQSAIRFRNKSFLRVTKTDYMVYAISNNRIYFKESNQVEGYHLGTASNEGRSKGIKIQALPKEFVGDFELLFDDEEKLNYIDATKKISY